MFYGFVHVQTSEEILINFLILGKSRFTTKISFVTSTSGEWNILTSNVATSKQFRFKLGNKVLLNKSLLLLTCVGNSQDTSLKS